MAYEPTEWKKGDVVTSQKLNKLEQGVAGAGGVMVAHIDVETNALDKTWKEIYDALCAGLFVSIHEVDEEYDAISIVYACYFNSTSNKYITQAYSYYDETSATFSTDSREGYPQFESEQ